MRMRRVGLVAGSCKRPTSVLMCSAENGLLFRHGYDCMKFTRATLAWLGVHGRLGLTGIYRWANSDRKLVEILTATPVFLLGRNKILYLHRSE